MDRQRLAFLLERQQDGTCTDAERAELDAWYHSFGPRERDIEIQLANEPAEKARIEKDIRDALPAFPEANLSISEETSGRLIRWYRMAAAVFLVLLVAGGIWWKRQAPSESDYAVVATARDQLGKVILPDSSTVWVKAGSSLKYLKNFHTDTRDVYLDGEAFFDVTHDAAKPFIVHTTDLKIKVLGTKFNVKSYAADKTVEATLVNGKVMVEKNHAPEPTPVILSPNQRATYSKVAKTVIVSSVADKQEIKMLDFAARERESLEFDAVAFTDVLTRLENRFDVNIHIDNRAGQTCLFTADFEQESLAEILEIIAVSHNVTYHIRGNEVYINGNICPNEVKTDPLMKN